MRDAKNCPFCGGEDIRFKFELPQGRADPFARISRGTIRLECAGCQMGTESEAFFSIGGRLKREAEMLARWNSRTGGGGRRNHPTKLKGEKRKHEVQSNWSTKLS
jgi:hypothetical protein